MTNQQDDTQPADETEADATVVDDTTEIDRLKDMAARAQADLQNAKARMEKESVDIRMYAMQTMIEKLLPTVDNFQRAFSHLPDDLKDHDWVKGLQATEQQLMKDLESVGLKKIESMGQAVNPEQHEILQAGEGEKDTVIQVLEDGYALNGKVIRAAKVVVGQG
ncbi:nucleotide exchange factor GrpE [Candidatus Peregrinibacteria bacterium]|jgi:molecular chaperone GrpE|nr:nucleotide exchange factor GrpE [Candidatus Peregrinibacteria bacterium]MBT5468335.1 nucleotide exchange factor GrpE [Candidatus Peregrinibacteria bacterium]MBT7337865.1 nucleotide exchange factor GrpE [Candidatus Peregrinibacteria bacterium]